ncbi:hypothetical protein DL98DRAFT_392004, partial [Cadophora sp. DSE1049]
KDLWVMDEDDWLGVSNSRERRKIQNRRNQRTFRKKIVTRLSTRANYVLGAKKRGEFQSAASGGTSAADKHLVPAPAGSLAEQSHETQGVDVAEAAIRIINLVNILQPRWEGNTIAMQRFEAFATRSYTARIGALNILPSLSQFHFIKALFANMEVLRLSDEEMDDEALSPFNISLGPFPKRPSLALARVSTLPIALKPTDLQHIIPHHPWIDLLPMPAMRDNIFRRDVDSFDEEELCHAMRGQAPDINPGLLVWRDPWDPTGWEVTEQFVRTWGCVIAGCTDLLHSTNAWRARRGERPLF